MQTLNRPVTFTHPEMDGVTTVNQWVQHELPKQQPKLTQGTGSTLNLVLVVWGGAAIAGLSFALSFSALASGHDAKLNRLESTNQAMAEHIQEINACLANYVK